MTAPRCFSLALIVFAVCVAPVDYPAWSAPPNRSISEPERRTVPGVPAQASRAHNICVRIISVTPVEMTGKTQLLRLEVERYYGKITTASLARAKENETMRFTILFPASPDADIRPGDLINYWLVGYTPMRGGNVADNRGIAPARSPQNGE